MKVEILKGEYAGKTGELVQQAIGTPHKLADGPAIENSVSVVVEGILHPIELDRSEIKPVDD